MHALKLYYELNKFLIIYTSFYSFSTRCVYHVLFLSAFFIFFLSAQTCNKLHYGEHSALPHPLCTQSGGVWMGQERSKNCTWSFSGQHLDGFRHLASLWPDPRPPNPRHTTHSCWLLFLLLRWIFGRQHEICIQCSIAKLFVLDCKLQRNRLGVFYFHIFLVATLMKVVNYIFRALILCSISF